jgi:hypothetical protein
MTPRPFGTIRSMYAFVPRRWWRSAPHAPLPDRKLVAFRMETAYGAKDARPPKGDLRDFLRWSGAMRRLTRTMPRSHAVGR